MMKSSLPVSIGRRCVGSAVLLCLLLGGCKTPPTLYRGLTQTQVTALKSASAYTAQCSSPEDSMGSARPAEAGSPPCWVWVRQAHSRLTRPIQLIHLIHPVR